MDNGLISPVSTALPYALRAIYLRDCTTWMDPRFDPLVPGQQLSAVFRTGEGSVDCRETVMRTESGETKIRSCTFKTRFDFAYTRAEADSFSSAEDDIEKSLVAKISVEIVADYLVNTPEFPDSEALQRWGNTNVVLQAWPYWREFCHSTLLRMNLPMTIIPMIQVSADQETPSSNGREAPISGDVESPNKRRRAANKKQS